MSAWVQGLVPESLAPFVSVLMAAVIVIALVLVSLWAARKVSSGSLRPGRKGHLPRLAVVGVTSVDPKRKLVLVRRDDVEHLILVGGQTDIVVEGGIGKAVRAARTSSAPSPFDEQSDGSVFEPIAATSAAPQGVPRPARLKGQPAATGEGRRARKPEPAEQAPTPTILPAETPTVAVEWPVFASPEEAAPKQPEEAAPEREAAREPMSQSPSVEPERRRPSPVQQRGDQARRDWAPEAPAVAAPEPLHAQEAASPPRPAAPPRPLATPTWPQRAATRVAAPSSSSSQTSSEVSPDSQTSSADEPAKPASSPSEDLDLPYGMLRGRVEPAWAPEVSGRDISLPAVEGAGAPQPDVRGRGPLSVRSFVTNVQEKQTRTEPAAPAPSPAPQVSAVTPPARPQAPSPAAPAVRATRQEPAEATSEAVRQARLSSSTAAPVPSVEPPRGQAPRRVDFASTLRSDLANLFGEDTAGSRQTSPSSTGPRPASIEPHPQIEAERAQSPALDDPAPRESAPSKKEASAPHRMSLEEEMEALLGDFTLDQPPERR
ncbi:FliO/MopB family protein [Consotaella salsifontis]|uniref:Flagellar biosynthesis protein, FliO n=1 Tax=Consotaella salsifontis TaxID=1365950 RepID=A0A1T4P837_9HYPH|nr:flagellar biosynthetic protein FliO [Consotaella salsifontis]SJZ87571.1 Flagellar biosynthesis protein, FliO [Consotaella salsifontis]